MSVLCLRRLKVLTDSLASEPGRLTNIGRSWSFKWKSRESLGVWTCAHPPPESPSNHRPFQLFLPRLFCANSKTDTTMRPILKYKKLTENAYPPVKGSDMAAGFDLRAAHDFVVKAKGKGLVKTDLQVMIPIGCYGRVAPRSGLAVKNFIDVGAGVVDSDYRGNVGVVLFNFGDEDFTVLKGDRIAQLICEKIEYPELVEVKENLEVTNRGDGGFGSTGVNDLPV